MTDGCKRSDWKPMLTLRGHIDLARRRGPRHGNVACQAGRPPCGGLDLGRRIRTPPDELAHQGTLIGDVTRNIPQRGAERPEQPRAGSGDGAVSSKGCSTATTINRISWQPIPVDAP